MGPELLGDAAWRALFTSGPLVENPGIRFDIGVARSLVVERGAVDQMGTARPSQAPADIGAVESL
jgi:hypothetical protein